MARPGLTRERILQTALRMADRDGLDAVTLRQVAAELRVHVTSLYNHVYDRDDIIDGLGELLVSEAELPTGDVDWEEWVRAMSKGLRRVAKAHPGAFAALYRRTARGPHADSAAQAGIAAFEKAGFSPADAFHAIRATSLAILGLAADELARAQVSGAGLRTDAADLTSERFAQVRAAEKAAARSDVWTFLIDTLIAGFAAQRDSRRRSRRPRRVRL